MIKRTKKKPKKAAHKEKASKPLIDACDTNTATSSLSNSAKDISLSKDEKKMETVNKNVLKQRSQEQSPQQNQQPFEENSQNTPENLVSRIKEKLHLASSHRKEDLERKSASSTLTRTKIRDIWSNPFSSVSLSNGSKNASQLNSSFKSTRLKPCSVIPEQKADQLLGCKMPNHRSSNVQPPPKALFTEYLTTKDLFENGKLKPDYFQEVIRFTTNRDNAFLTLPKMHQDVIISGMKNQNRSLEGDLVIIKLYPQSDWKKVKIYKADTKLSRIEEGELTDAAFEQHLIEKEEEEENDAILNLEQLYDTISEETKEKEKYIESSELSGHNETLIEDPIIEQEFLSKIETNYEYQMQPTGYVVHILKSNMATTVYPGDFLYSHQYKTSNQLLFKPRDSRMPYIVISSKECLKMSIEYLTTHVFGVQIYDWPLTDLYPLGCVKMDLGVMGEIETEIKSILLQNNIDTTELDTANLLASSSLHDLKVIKEDHVVIFFIKIFMMDYYYSLRISSCQVLKSESIYGLVEYVLLIQNQLKI
jgi:exoribonuclease R